jgi:LysM repeat protein
MPAADQKCCTFAVVIQSKPIMKFSTSIKSVITILILQSLIVFNLSGQVLVEKSTEKVIIRGTTYFIHTVAKGQTAFSIARAYSVTVEMLHNENPESVYGLKEGQVLKIPLVQEQPVVTPQKPRDTDRYVYHVIVAGETIYSLSRKYDVSQAMIIEANPGIDPSDIPIGVELAIPKKEMKSEMVSLEPVLQEEFTLYKVRQGETLATIARKFGVASRDIRRANGGLLFPRVNDTIKIPGRHYVDAKGDIITDQAIGDTVSLIVEEDIYIPSLKPVGFTDISRMRGKVDIAVMLPLFLAENSVRIDIDSTTSQTRRVRERPFTWIFPRSVSFIEMYEGILLAADDLRKSGLDVTVHTFDTRGDLHTVNGIIESGRLREMDMIIGPIYSYNLERVTQYAERYSIPVVSPVPLRDNSVLKENSGLFVVNPSLKTAQERLAITIANHYDKNIVFIYSDTATVNNESLEFRDMIMRELNYKTTSDQISLKQVLFKSRSNLPSDTLNRLSHALNPLKENIIVLATENEPALGETIMNLHTLTRRYQITVYGYPLIRSLEDNIEINYLTDLGISFFSPFKVDYNSERAKRFLLKFRETYKTEPGETSFAWVGYDITTYFVSGLGLHGKRFLSEPVMHNPELLQSRFDFRRSSSSDGFENKGLFRLTYTRDMELVTVDEKDSGYFR